MGMKWPHPWPWDIEEKGTRQLPCSMKEGAGQRNCLQQWSGQKVKELEVQVHRKNEQFIGWLYFTLSSSYLPCQISFRV